MDIEQELSKALADPEIMNKVSAALSSLQSGGESPSEKESTSTVNANGISNLLGNLGGSLNDDRTRLLIALKPFLSEKRAPYMDSAITMLKLTSMGKLGKDLKLF